MTMFPPLFSGANAVGAGNIPDRTLPFPDIRPLSQVRPPGPATRRPPSAAQAMLVISVDGLESPPLPAKTGSSACTHHTSPVALHMIPVRSHHPLPRGTRIVTLQGEVDCNQNDVEVVTPEGAIGRITGIGNERDNGDPGFCYDLEFDNGAWFTRDDFEFDDATRYRILPAS